MRVTRLAIFGVAGAAAAGAGLIAVNLATPAPAPEPVIITAQPAEPPVKLVEVLAASRDIAMGERVDGALEWVQWPESAMSAGLLRRDEKPNAMDETKGSIARQAFFTGEPIRDAKLIKSDRGFMSAILPEGKRAIAVPISADTSAGGFILPNDHVDVIMAREKSVPGAAASQGQNSVETTTILKNLRVLAIDQTIEEKDGTRVVVGSTATLEVDPQQAEALTAASRMTDRLILSLRSLADSVPGSPGYARFLLEQELAPQIRVVRYGKTTDITTRN